MTTPMGNTEDIEALLANREYSDVKFNFANKNFIMTGASSGIGRAVAKKLMRNGANVAVLGRNIEKLQELDQDPKKLGQCIPCRVDLAKPSEIEETFFKLIQTFEGQLHGIINCAGVMMSKDYKLTTLQEFDHVMTINVRSPMQLMSMAAPWLKDTGGCVVNTSASPVPRPQCTLFSVTKSCLDMLTKCAALELSQYGVRVNSVAPGATDTPMRLVQPFGPLTQDQNRVFVEQMSSEVPLLGQINLDRDVANCILFLASDEATFINGQILTVDGGTNLASQGCWVEWNAVEGNFPEETEELEVPESAQIVQPEEQAKPRSTISKIFGAFK